MFEGMPSSVVIAGIHPKNQVMEELEGNPTPWEFSKSNSVGIRPRTRHCGNISQDEILREYTPGLYIGGIRSTNIGTDTLRNVQSQV